MVRGRGLRGVYGVNESVWELKVPCNWSSGLGSCALIKGVAWVVHQPPYPYPDPIEPNLLGFLVMMSLYKLLKRHEKVGYLKCR